LSRIKRHLKLVYRLSCCSSITSTPAFSTPAGPCRCFHSRIFHPCKIVPIFQLLHFHHLHFLVLSCRYFHSRIFHPCKIVLIFQLLHFHRLHFLVLSCRYFHSRFFHSCILSAPAWTISPTPALFVAKRRSIYSQENTLFIYSAFWGRLEVGYRKSGMLKNKSGNISKTRKDRGKVTMDGL